MPLFQNTVVHKYLNSQDSTKLSEKWELYKSHFFNPVIQENIRNSKEEQYQEGFLRDLFVKILGYTLNPADSFNLTTELKNVKDSKKADGGILVKDKVVGVIELKGTNTTDLGKVEEQAFGYKNNQAGCVYVITSNFEKLRFYIDNAIEHIEFNLFTLTEEDFKLLYLSLGFENIKNNIPKKLKDESLSQEELITKQLYKDYSRFKRELFQNLCDLNPQYEPLELFKKSQKLLDRFLFLFFAEDRNLLPPNSVRVILKQWKQLKELDAYTPLYDRFKKYFGYLNTGFKGKQYDVFPYNGGLFKPDEVLDTIQIDDDLLYQHSFKLSDYDFESEVDVNILGHIFENSLNELDEITAQLEGKTIDRADTKRKKDGVFYTPKYITKYIVENTVGKLCEEKKIELDITDEAYQPAKQRSRKRLDNLSLYRDWLLQLTICDPACGSGAFLNQALDFLINEHKYIDELSAKYNKDAFVLSDVEKSILENNLFGVDLNEESVQIARLSLWLRTAQPNRKLNDLSDNIKCGNSLIDDVSVAGDSAFNWQEEFPQIFDKDGFDVIIGNPPYVRSRELFSQAEKDFYLKNYTTTSYQLDLYKLFIEKSCKLINSNGKLSFITPSVFLTNDYDKPLRKYILEKYALETIVNSDKDVFNDASVKTVTFIISNFKQNNKVRFYKNESGEFHFDKEIDQISFIEQNYLINEKLDSSAIPIINKLNQFEKLGKYFEVKNGIKVRKDLLFENKQNENFKPFVLGKNISSFFISFDNQYIDYKAENEKLFTNQAFRTPDIFEQDKLIVRQILGNRIMTCFDDQSFYTDQTTYVINKKIEKQELKFLLGILNSKLIYYYFTNTSSDNKITFPKVKRSQLLELPYIPYTESSIFIEKVDEIQSFLLDSYEHSNKFQRTLQREFEQLDKLSRKLENWYELTYTDFLKELKKKKIELSLSQKAEWEDYFLTEQKLALEIQNKITSTDKEIDAMVYELYGLSEEEIVIVENS